MNEFESYLKTKKIDPVSFQKKSPDQYKSFENQFMQMHPNSFTAQKLFLINEIRRENSLKEEFHSEKKQTKKIIKPKITPRKK